MAGSTGGEGGRGGGGEAKGIGSAVGKAVESPEVEAVAEGTEEVRGGLAEEAEGFHCSSST